MPRSYPNQVVFACLIWEWERADSADAASQIICLEPLTSTINAQALKGKSPKKKKRRPIK